MTMGMIGTPSSGGSGSDAELAAQSTRQHLYLSAALRLRTNPLQSLCSRFHRRR